MSFVESGVDKKTLLQLHIEARHDAKTKDDNMVTNLPTMASSTHSHTAYTAGDFSSAPNDRLAVQAITPNHGGAVRLIGPPLDYVAQTEGIHTMALPARRIVKVFIADNNENIPLDDCLLFVGNEKITDATDQELFFEIDIKTILKNYNEKRTKVIDKKVKDRTEYLEPAKIRDLKMVVVVVATL